MTKTDRHFEILQALRNQRISTAENIAQRVGVSVRTIYRDIDSLNESGFQIIGRPRQGFQLTAPAFLPPLNLTRTELIAVTIGLQYVAKTQDHILQAAAQDLITKIGDTTQRNPSSLPLSILPHLAPNEKMILPIGPILQAIQANQKIDLNYRNSQDSSTQRIVWPLQVEMWAKVWTLTAWCELKDDFRVFRLDRIQSIIILEEQFNEEPGRTYQDFLASMKENSPSN